MPNSSDQKKGLTKEQKVGFAMLFLFGILAVVMGGLQMRNNIYSPFVFEPKQNEQNVSQLFDEKTRLQKIDTDKDGLNDYEELNFHNTSPYIPDTDSDGIPDKEEIDQGTDPLCPQGESCEKIRAESQPQQNTSTAGSPLRDQASTENVLNNARSQFSSTTAQTNNSGGDSNPTGLSAKQIQKIANDPEALRKLLSESGQISEEKLNQIDDETLLKTAEQILKKKGLMSTTTQQ